MQTAFILRASVTLTFLAALAVKTLAAQDASVPPETLVGPRIVVSSAPPSDNIITVPAFTSWTGSIGINTTVPKAKGNEIVDWLTEARAKSGLRDSGLHAWHIVIHYDQFDEDGDKVHSGRFEEFWSGPRSFRATYESDNFSQTDVATATGLFRAGDQRWPNRVELQSQAAILDPFAYAATLHDVRVHRIVRVFGPNKLNCDLIDKVGSGVSASTEYCFAQDSNALRYSKGSGWLQTAYNNVVSFQGHSIGREVDVTDGGKPHLHLVLETLDTWNQSDSTLLVPPNDAINLSGKRVTGVQLQPIHTEFPEWPSSLLRERFKVTVAIVVGKDGHVLTAQAIDGPPNAYKSAEKTALKWTFSPYSILGEPSEVEAKIQLSNN